MSLGMEGYNFSGAATEFGAENAGSSSAARAEEIEQFRFADFVIARGKLRNQSEAIVIASKGPQPRSRRPKTRRELWLDSACDAPADLRASVDHPEPA